MPRQLQSAKSNQSFGEWVNQGLKKAQGPSRVVQVGLLIAIGLAVAALYLLQSSEIVTMSRRVQSTREELALLEQDNAELATEIAKAGSIEQVKKRAEAMGFQAVANVVYLPVRYLPLEDIPSPQEIFSR
jgi:hypothetical protein